MESTGQELRHPIMTSMFPVVPLLFRNTVVVHAPPNSSDWRCQTSLSLGGVTSLVYISVLRCCYSQKEKSAIIHLQG